MQRPAAPVGPFHCPVCGARTTAAGFTDNVRESGRSACCGAWTRLRALAVVAAGAAAEMTGNATRDLAGVARIPGFLVYNTEATSAVHAQLRRGANYVASEYFEGDHASGSSVNGVLHEDLQDLSFPSGTIDLVLSTDVFEHMPDPYRAHDEVLRVLRPGGRHVFTVPYDRQAADDDVRAVLDDAGNLVHLAEPQYHGDPLRPDGVLVFTIFGQAMLDRLRELGYEVRTHEVDGRVGGFPGATQLVFEAIRPLGSEAAPPAGTHGTAAVVLVVRDVHDLVRGIDRIPADHAEAPVVVVDAGSVDATPSLLAALEGDVTVVRLPPGTTVEDAESAGRAAAGTSRDVVVVAPEVPEAPAA